MARDEEGSTNLNMPFMADGTPFAPKSAIGQHILIDSNLVAQTAAQIPPGETVIEIGPGPGTLTGSLLERNKVVAYEIDERCEAPLGRLAVGHDLTVRWKNFLDASVEELEAEKPFHVVGNIPFHISEPLLVKLTGVHFSSAVMLVGDNLVRSMMAPNPDNDSWSRLSLITRGFFDVESLAFVPRSSFVPPPRVDAGLIRMVRRDATPAWRSDAVVRSYRALVEAGVTNSTVAKALKTVVVLPGGDAETSGGNRRSKNRRTERRLSRQALSGMAADYNMGRGHDRDSSGDEVSQDMLRIVSRTVDERILSRPLSGVNNNDLRKICSAITTAINRRKKTR